MSQYPNVLIRASAGTGKTFQLSNRYISLLNSGAPAEEILATTFTRKAAGEILDRVVIRLAEAAVDEVKLKELASHIAAPPINRARCLELLAQLTRNLHRLRICTLDSFFSQLAGSLSLELGLPPGWKIVEEIHDAQLRNESIEAILQSGSTREVSRLMNLLTKGEAERSVSSLIRETVKHLYDLYVETEADAWRRFPEPKFLTNEKLLETTEQLHTVEIPEDKRWQRARENDWRAAMLNDWELFISKGLAAKVMEGKTAFGSKPISTDLISIYQRLLGHARAQIIDALAKQTAGTHELLEKFDKVYQSGKHEMRVLRFEDITRFLSRLATHDHGQHQYRLDAPLSHLLLDEFQDTSLAQWLVLRPFAERVTKRSGQQSFFWLGGQSSFFCVGDVKQAIYGWRGGRSEIFNALEAQLDDLQHETLNESRRSAQPIIDTVNRVFTNLTDHPNLETLEHGVGQWCKKFERHTTAMHDLHGYAELITAPRGSADERQIDATLRYTAEKIDELVQECPGRSVGVLCRRNTVVAQVIYELRRRGVPASEEGGNPLTDSAAVQVMISLLKLADHPHDRAARFHLARSPLGPLLDFAYHADDQAAEKLSREARRSLMADGYGPTIHRWAEMLAASCNRRDRNRLQQMVELAFEFQSIATLRSRDFVRYVEGQRVSDPTTADVRVMTVHQAKGLQFDAVVLPDLDAELLGQNGRCVVGQPDPTQPVDQVCLYRSVQVQALLPDDLQQLFHGTTEDAVSEAMCVLYVALTRAKHALHMIVSPSRANERTLHKTFAGLLRAALTGQEKLEPGTTAFQVGDPNWPSFDPAQRPRSAVKTEAPAMKLAQSLDRRESGLQFTSPSGLEGGQRLRVADILRLDNTTALTRGTLIHAWFECLEWLDDGTVDEAVLRQVASRIDTTGLNVGQLLKRFCKMLEADEIASCLSRAFYISPHDPPNGILLPAELEPGKLNLQVYNEGRFVVRDGDQILNGTIDRLVLMYDGDQPVAADVVDFKTDAVDVANVEQFAETVEYYRPQIDAYCRAVSKQFHLPMNRISARLLFVSPGVSKLITPAFTDATA